ncbi:UspA domain-containing protein [[Leptolyngbya] sp. PCC 7376]|uniref:universal stress protein n=1 Tax=[Leptolyngbya] sp. PCC 7376 TaxID=111781 RepID=UPI00029ED1AA|nr:universal stress protein [[Leptolyngbya] sp. PCC 7376]AFY38466.1 UspA domain-containing protein [[Leptolyngbya] sp. PCC 7376]
MFKTILFPIDQSREARDAAETVVNLVKTCQSRLVLLSVVEPSAPEGDAKNVMNSEEAVAKLLKGAHDLFEKSGIEADTIEREGMPSFTICDVADEIEADLIVMGCRGMGLTNDGAAESVTSKVTNLSPCPVLVVP